MNKWRYKIQIKHLFEDDTTPELVESLCDSLVLQLDKIEKSIEASKDIDGDIDYLAEEVGMNKDNFEFLGKLCSGQIKKEDWKNFSFNGDFQEEFNGYLEGLYDLGDQRIQLKTGIIEKFIWIG